MSIDRKLSGPWREKISELHPRVPLFLSCSFVGREAGEAGKQSTEDIVLPVVCATDD